MYDQVIDKDNPNSALKVSKGVENPVSVNQNYLKNAKKDKNFPSTIMLTEFFLVIGQYLLGQ